MDWLSRFRNPPLAEEDTITDIRVLERLDQLLYRTNRIERKVDMLSRMSVADVARDQQRDTKLMALEDDILAKLEVAETKQDGFLVILQALKDNQNNPAKLQQIAQAVDRHQADWETAFATTTQPEPPPPAPQE